MNDCHGDLTDGSALKKPLMISSTKTVYQTIQTRSDEHFHNPASLYQLITETHVAPDVSVL